jgi:alkylation response protein AidB-like acyl-CoA dehydrogenase
MDFSLSEEQRLPRDSVDRFARERAGVAAWRRIASGEAESDTAEWRRMAELGWLGLAVPEALGGLGGGPVEVMLLMEGLGRGLIAQSYVETAVFGAKLAQHAAPGRREALLGALLAGELRVALAAIERGQRFNLSRVATTAKRDGDGWRLDGEKSFVPAASSADTLIVSAAAGEGLSLFLVPSDTPGLLRTDFVTADGRRASALRLDGVRVPADALLDDPGCGWPLLEEAVDRATAALCAEAVGAMDVLREATGEYLKTRKQFGQALGGFRRCSTGWPRSTSPARNRAPCCCSRPCASPRSGASACAPSPPRRRGSASSDATSRTRRSSCTGRWACARRSRSATTRSG